MVSVYIRCQHKDNLGEGYMGTATLISSLKLSQYKKVFLKLL